MGTIKEDWRPVPGYEGLYEVSSMGRVRSLNFRLSGQTRVMKAAPNSLGYPNLSLRKDGKTRVVLVHRLVAAAFIPNPEGKSDVNHKDGNKANNTPKNLEWVSRAENLWHGRNVLGHQPDRPVVVVNLSTGDCQRFPSRAAAASVLGLDPRSLRKVLTGDLKKTRGFTAHYVKDNIC